MYKKYQKEKLLKIATMIMFFYMNVISITTLIIKDTMFFMLWGVGMVFMLLIAYKIVSACIQDIDDEKTVLKKEDLKRLKRIGRIFIMLQILAFVVSVILTIIYEDGDNTFWVLFIPFSVDGICIGLYLNIDEYILSKKEADKSDSTNEQDEKGENK